MDRCGVGDPMYCASWKNHWIECLKPQSPLQETQRRVWCNNQPQRKFQSLPLGDSGTVFKTPESLAGDSRAGVVWETQGIANPKRPGVLRELEKPLD